MSLSSIIKEKILRFITSYWKKPRLIFVRSAPSWRKKSNFLRRTPNERFYVLGIKLGVDSGFTIHLFQILKLEDVHAMPTLHDRLVSIACNDSSVMRNMLITTLDSIGLSANDYYLDNRYVKAEVPIVKENTTRYENVYQSKYSRKTYSRTTYRTNQQTVGFIDLLATIPSVKSKGWFSKKPHHFLKIAFEFKTDKELDIGEVIR